MLDRKQAAAFVDELMKKCKKSYRDFLSSQRELEDAKPQTIVSREEMSAQEKSFEENRRNAQNYVDSLFQGKFH